MKLLAIRLGYQPKNFWPGTRKTIAKSLVMSEVVGVETPIGFLEAHCKVPLTLERKLKCHW